MTFEIRPFVAEDIDFAVAQTAREGWDTTTSMFRVFLEHDPDGCFVACVGARRIGMISTTRYSKSAWIGNLIVIPDCRREGVGERLMLHAIAHLEASGIGAIRLEADPLGVGIYRRLGFVDQFESPRFQKSPPHRLGQRAADRLQASDMDAARTFDVTSFGDDRGRLLVSLLNSARAAYCVRDDGQMAGFAMVLPSTVGVRLGPSVADNAAVAETLINAVFADFPDDSIIAAVPSVNRTAVQLFQSCGFARRPSSLRMLRGQVAAKSDSDKLFTIANGATG